MEKISAEEFVDKIDELCFKYKYEITPDFSNSGLPIIMIKGNNDEASVLYIDGDGR